MMNSSKTLHGAQFSINELVLCYEPDPLKAKVLYDAKILDTDVTKDDRGRKVSEYYIHFQGWNKSWDRWVLEDQILEINVSNRALQAKLYDKAKKKRTKLSRRGSVDDKDDGSLSSNGSSNSDDTKVSQLPLISLDIPKVLAVRLEDDCYNIKRKKKLVHLPRSPTVNEIFNKYYEYCEKIIKTPQGREISLNVVYEMLHGLNTYFNFYLFTLLLYNFEREQYYKFFPPGKENQPAFIKNSVSPIKPLSTLNRQSITPNNKSSTPKRSTTQSQNKSSTSKKPTTAKQQAVTAGKPTKSPKSQTPKQSATSKPSTTPTKPSTTPIKQSTTRTRLSTTPNKTPTICNKLTTPSKSSTTPAKSPATPAKSSTTPAKPSTTPAKSSTTPGKSSISPGKSPVTAGKSSTTPSKSSTTPSKSSTTPSKSSITPSRSSTTPTKASTTAKSSTTLAKLPTPDKLSVTPSKQSVTPNKLPATPKLAIKPVKPPNSTELNKSSKLSESPKSNKDGNTSKNATSPALKDILRTKSNRKQRKSSSIDETVECSPSKRKRKVCDSTLVNNIKNLNVESDENLPTRAARSCRKSVLQDKVKCVDTNKKKSNANEDGKIQNSARLKVNSLNTVPLCSLENNFNGLRRSVRSRMSSVDEVDESLPVGSTAKTLEKSKVGIRRKNSINSKNCISELDEKDDKTFMPYPQNSSGNSPADIYGIEHLLRLFVKLPILLSCAGMEEKKVLVILQYVSKFLTYLSKQTDLLVDSTSVYSESII